MSRKPKAISVFTPATLLRLLSPTPVVAVEYVTAYTKDDDNYQVCIETPKFDDLQRDTFDNVYLASWVEYNGGKYRKSTLKQLGVSLCLNCAAPCAPAHLVEERCSNCRELTQLIGGKTAPNGGWRKHGDQGPYYGLEIECELPAGPESGPNTFRTLMRKAEWYLPLAYTSDCSLTHGVELNTHMMSLEYLKTNQHLITHSLERLVDGGATHHYQDKPTSGVHIHVDRYSIEELNSTIVQEWLKNIRPFLLGFSFRTEDRFHYYCEGGYSYFGKRNNNNTWECRGFSSELVLKHPDSVYHICAWVATMAYVSRNPWLIYKTPAEALCAAGHAESAIYIRDVLDVTTIDMIPSVTVPEVTMEICKNQAVQLNDGRVCWYLDGDILSGYRVILAGSRTASYVDFQDVVKWFTVQPPVQMTLEKYFTYVLSISEVQPCAS